MPRHQPENALKIIFEGWREDGLMVDKHDLWFEFIRLISEELQRLQQDEHPSVTDRRTMTSIESIIQHSTQDGTKKRRKAKEYHMGQLMGHCQAKLLKPQRLVDLTLEEEERRVLWGWRSFDRLQQLIWFGTDEERAEVFSDLDILKAYVKNGRLAIIAADHVFYAHWETAKLTPEERAIGRKMLQESASGGGSQSVACEEDDGMLPARGEGLTQKRGLGDPKAEKFRVTVELEQNVLNWGAGFEELPIGQVGRVRLVVPGAHFDAGNVCIEKDVFIHLERFIYKGKPVDRKAGENPGGLARSFRELRRNNEDVKKWLKEAIDFFQQPAANADTYVTKCTVRLHAERFPVSALIRDKFPGGSSALVHTSQWTLNQARAEVPAKMTAVMQNTDTDEAHLWKAFMNEVHDDLRRQMREAAERQGSANLQFSTGLYEMLKIVYETWVKLKESDETSQRVVRTFIRNGWLSYRPDWTMRRLRPVNQAEWYHAMKMETGNHRMMTSWVNQRFNFMDDDGVPRRMNETETEWQEEEIDPDVFEGDGVARHLNSWNGVEGLRDGVGFPTPEIELLADTWSPEQDAVPEVIKLQKPLGLRRETMPRDPFLTAQVKVRPTPKARAKTKQLARERKKLRRNVVLS